MLYLLEKKGKIAVALGAPPPNSCWPPAAGGSAFRPSSSYPITCYSYFLERAFVALTSLLSKRNKKNLD